MVEFAAVLGAPATDVAGSPRLCVDTTLEADTRAMHILFVHQNFPAQFGPFAFRLARTPGYRCTFVSQKVEGTFRGVRCLKYATRGGATEKTHYCSRTFENAVWHAAGVHDALAA